MSSCQSSPDEAAKSARDREITLKLEEGFKKKFSAELLSKILPTMLMGEDYTTLVDVAFGVDKRRLVIESLREVATRIEAKYTLDDIKGGIEDE